MVWLSTIASCLALALILCEPLPRINGRRSPMHCDCRTGWMAACHYKSGWLLVLAIVILISAVFSGSLAGRAIAGAHSMYYFWRWWTHSKNGRKKLKDKVLGVVRETAAGLKVVPVPGGAS